MDSISQGSAFWDDHAADMQDPEYREAFEAAAGEMASANCCAACQKAHDSQEDADEAHYPTDGDYYGRRWA